MVETQKAEPSRAEIAQKKAGKILGDLQVNKAASVVDRDALLGEACLATWETDPYQSKRFLGEIKDPAAVEKILEKLYSQLSGAGAVFRQQLLAGETDKAVRTLKKMSSEDLSKIPPLPEVLDGAEKLSQAVEKAWCFSAKSRDVLRNRLMNLGIDAARIEKNPEEATKNFLETTAKFVRR